MRVVGLVLAVAFTSFGCERGERRETAAPQPVAVHGGEAPALAPRSPDALAVIDDAGVSDAGATSIAVADVPASPRTGSREYIACGCGCCGTLTQETRCLYRSRGDDIERIIAEDRRARSSPHCAVAGCAMGVRYRYCD